MKNKSYDAFETNLEALYNLSMVLASPCPFIFTSML